MEETQYVYALSNPSFKDMPKVGWSKKYPTIRALDLFKTGVPTPFKVEFIIFTKDGAKLESQIHIHIKQYRVSDNREFFKIPIDELKNILTNELNLELEYNILDVKSSIFKNKQINELNDMYESLKNTANEFIKKITQERTKFVINKSEDKVYVKVYRYNDEEFKRKYGEQIGINCLTTINPYLDSRCYPEYDIKDCCYFVEQDLKQYEKHICDINENYDRKIELYGGKQIRNNTIEFKKWILHTRKHFNAMLERYEWDFNIMNM